MDKPSNNIPLDKILLWLELHGPNAVVPRAVGTTRDHVRTEEVSVLQLLVQHAQMQQREVEARDSLLDKVLELAQDPHIAVPQKIEYEIRRWRYLREQSND